MQKQWQDFLRDQAPEDVNPASTGKQANRLVDLSTLTLLSVGGADAASFLQAQLSNDVMRLGESASQLSAWCDAKGRVLTLLRIFRHDDTYLLLLPAELRESIFKRLQMFILRAKVELADVSDSLPRFAFFGANAQNLLNSLGDVPEVNEVTNIDDAQCLRLPGETPAYVFVGASDVCQRLWMQLRLQGVPAQQSDWQLNRILAGQPEVLAATQGEFVPQMLNLHWIGAVDFHKGCYPGQEVVARLQYRGKLKRRMVLLQLDEAQIPEPGTPVTDEKNNRIGQVVAAATTGTAQQVLLAVTQVGALENGHINGIKLALLELPYPTPDEPD